MTLSTWPVPPEWRPLIDDFLSSQRAAGRPETTIYTRRQHLEHLARGICSHPADVSGEMLTSWAASQDWAPETRRSRRCTFRAFWSWAVATERLTLDAGEALPRVKPALPKVRAIPADPLRRAIHEADPRAALILRLGAELGLRRAEIARIHASDLTPDLMGWSLRVHGKGGRERMVPLPEPLSATLTELLAHGGWLFPGRCDGHLSPRYVGKLATRALPGDWTTHALRHRFAGVAHETCGDLATVQDLLGHASPVTTRIYLPPNPARARAAVSAMARAA